MEPAANHANGNDPQKNEASSGDLFGDLNGSRQTPQAEARQISAKEAFLAEQIGLEAPALSALDRKGKRSLLTMLQSGPRAAQLTVRILNAVHRTSPGRENEAINKLSEYPGSLVILQDFLNQIGHDDPFIATERAQVIVLPISALPARAKISHGSEDAEQQGRVTQARHRESVRGASGHIITGMIYCAYDQESPASSAGFFSKRQAVTRPFEAFNPQKFSGASQRGVEAQRSGSLRKILRQLDLFDLESPPEREIAPRSPVLARNQAVYEELLNAVRQYREMYQGLLYGEQIVLGAVQALNLRTDSGGTFYGWFERQIAGGAVLPQGILAAYQSLRDPHVHLEPEVERDFIRGLIAYQRVHSFIDKRAALGAVKSDLEEFDKLGPNDPLRLNSAMLEAKRALQELAAQPGGEMRLSEFSLLVSLGGLTDFRRQMNDRLLGAFRSEFKEALSFFQPFFIQPDGRWHEDCLSESVPMKRLGNSIYGARLGVARAWHSPHQKRRLLGQPDFKHLRDALFLRTVCTDDNQLLLSMPVANFRAMLEGVVSAYRKARFLESKLNDYQEQRKQQGLPPLEVVREDIGSALDQWKPALPIGHDLRPEETFLDMQQENQPQKFLPLRQLVACIKARRLGSPELQSTLQEIEIQTEAGLYSPRHIDALNALQAEAWHFTPAAEIKDEISTVKEMLKSPLVYCASPWTRDKLQLAWLSRAEVLELKTCAGFKLTFDTLGLAASAAIQHLAYRIRNLRAARIYSGRINSTPDGRRQLELMPSDFSDYTGEKHLCGMRYFDPQELELKLAELESAYSRADTLPGEWFKKAKTLCSADGRDILARQGFALVELDTYYAARNLGPGNLVFVSNDFVSAVDNLWLGAQASQTTAPAAGKTSLNIGPSNHFRWSGIGADRQALIGFGQYRGRRVAEVATELLSSGDPKALEYFSRFILQRDFPPHVKKIAAKIVELARPGAPFPQDAFHAWLAEQAELRQGN